MGERKYKGLNTLLVILLIIVFIFIWGLVALNNYDGYDKDGFFALLFVSFFGIISCIALIPMFVKRKKNFDSALNYATQVGHWSLSNELAKVTAKQKYEDLKLRNKALFITMSIFFGIFMILFSFFLYGEELLLFELTMLIVYAIVAFAAFGYPWFSYKRKFLTATDVYLGENAVIIGKEFHIFSSFMARYTSSEYDAENMMIVINYETLNRTGWTAFFAQVPVPEGLEQKAIDYVNLIDRLHGR